MPTEFQSIDRDSKKIVLQLFFARKDLSLSFLTIPLKGPKGTRAHHVPLIFPRRRHDHLSPDWGALWLDYSNLYERLSPRKSDIHGQCSIPRMEYYCEGHQMVSQARRSDWSLQLSKFKSKRLEDGGYQGVYKSCLGTARLWPVRTIVTVRACLYFHRPICPRSHHQRQYCRLTVARVLLFLALRGLASNDDKIYTHQFIPLVTISALN